MKYNAAALYAQAAAQIHMDENAAERIFQALERAAAQPGPPARRRGRRGLGAGLLAAVLAVFMLAGIALAAEGAGILPETLRHWLGVAADAAPESVTYETVTEAENARWADIYHEGKGELYASADRRTVPGAEYQVARVSVSTVTQEQYERYTWLVRQKDSDVWYRAEPAAEDIFPYGGAVFRVLLPASQDGTLSMEICGGYESEGGSAFEICRLGIFSLNTVAYAPGVHADIGSQGIAFVNEETGERGYVTDIEIYHQLIVIRCHVPGIYETSLRCDLEGMYALIAWPDSLHPGAFSFTCADGKRCIASQSYSSGREEFLPGDEWLITYEDRYGVDSIDPENFVSVTVLDETYAMIPMAE